MTARARLRTYSEIGRLLVANRDLFDASSADRPGGGDEGSAQKLAQRLEAAGPTFVKLGQMLSTRSDLLPPAYTKALGRLQDDVAPFDAAEAREVFAAEIGVEVDDCFGSFDDRPLGAASLGQVHRATLRDGTPVVVKVQRPGIQKRIDEDMDVLGELANFLGLHSDAGRRYGFADFFDQFRRSLIDELDYRREAGNLAMLRSITDQQKAIVVPSPITDFTATRVLTMERIEGNTLNHLGGVVRADLAGHHLADELLRAYLEQIFRHGFFHADPHPGNVMLTRDHRLAIIDLGMVGYLQHDVRAQLLRLVIAVHDGRGEQAADVMARLGRRLDEFDDDRLRRDIAEVVAKSRTPLGGRRMEGTSAGDVMMQVARACGESGLRPPPELGLLGRALANLDAVTRILDPSFDPTEALGRHAPDIIAADSEPSTGSMVGALLETRDFVEELPRRANRVLESLSRGDLRLKVHAFDEAEMLRSLQKVANRMAMGIVVAALVVGSAIFSLAPSSKQLVDLHLVGFACFVAAVVAGFALLASIAIADRDVNARARRRRRR